jgi:hypothetical protein
MLLRRNRAITWFVICWTLLFHYETLRANYLSPLLKRELPKLHLLFPPAGWIMFFNIDRAYGFAEVYGIKDRTPMLLDPHDILETRAVGYDNIHRNVLIGVLYPQRAPQFCPFVKRKFPEYDSFAVVYAQYPDIVKTPERILRQVVYRCE